MFRKKLSLTFAFLLLFTFCALLPSTGYAGDFLRGRVTKVSDGDTVWVRLENGNRVKIRIWGIDTPEKFRSQKLDREARKCMVPRKRVVLLGKMASQKARELLDQKRVLIETHGRGHHRRLLARLLLEDGTDFGFEMIRTGYSCVYRKNAPRSYFRAQSEARRAKRGLWKVDKALMDCLCSGRTKFRLIKFWK